MSKYFISKYLKWHFRVVGEQPAGRRSSIILPVKSGILKNG
jgi:hypothetical protein